MSAVMKSSAKLARHLILAYLRLFSLISLPQQYLSPDPRSRLLSAHHSDEPWSIPRENLVAYHRVSAGSGAMNECTVWCMLPLQPTHQPSHVARWLAGVCSGYSSSSSDTTYRLWRCTLAIVGDRLTTRRFQNLYVRVGRVCCLKGQPPSMVPAEPPLWGTVAEQRDRRPCINNTYI